MRNIFDLGQQLSIAERTYRYASQDRHSAEYAAELWAWLDASDPRRLERVARLVTARRAERQARIAYQRAYNDYRAELRVTQIA